MQPQWDPLMQKMNQTVFTKLTPSPAASALIRAAAHEWHSISAGLDLIKLSISDNPCLYTSLHSICTLVFTLISFLSFFCPAAVCFWIREEDVDFLIHSAHHILKCASISCVETSSTSWSFRQKRKRNQMLKEELFGYNCYLFTFALTLVFFLSAFL